MNLNYELCLTLANKVCLDFHISKYADEFFGNLQKYALLYFPKHCLIGTLYYKI